MHRPLKRPRVPSPGWRPLAAATAVVAVAVLGWMWARDSSLARVERVYITGLSSPDEARIRRALHDAARDMTTLHVRTDALEAAVAAYPTVTAVDADPDFPHELTISVRERRAVANLDVPGRPVPVAPDGTLLTGMREDPTLPVVRAPRGVEDRRARRAIEVLAAAPQLLHRRSQRAYEDDRGLVVELRHGPELVFGDATRARAKWAAATRVLAEPSAKGAVYLDIRVPERVAAGGVETPSMNLELSLSADARPLAQVQPD